MALLTPPDPAGFRAISDLSWFIKPTLTPGATSVTIKLPVGFGYYHVNVTIGVTGPTGSWSTTWGIRNQTANRVTIWFSTPIPANGAIEVEISA